MYLLKRYVPEDDISGLYSFVFDEHLLIKMPGQPIIHSKNEFRDWLVRQLHGFYHDLYLLYDKQLVKGYLLSFDYRVYDGHCQIYGCWNSGINYDPLRLFIDRLCSEYPLRKIFLKITGKESVLMQSAKEVGFVEEACLKEYKYIEGQFVNMHVLSYLIRSNDDGI